MLFLGDLCHFKIFIDGKLTADAEQDVSCILPDADLLTINSYVNTLAFDEVLLRFIKASPFCQPTVPTKTNGRVLRLVVYCGCATTYAQIICRYAHKTK